MLVPFTETGYSLLSPVIRAIIDMDGNPSLYENCVGAILVTDRPQTELSPWCGVLLQVEE